MKLPESFLEDLRQRTNLAALIGRKTRLVRSGRQLKGCCPFHTEKTPSFYVYDDHYHCFGCGAHGDAIAFTMASGGGGFMEAVAALAAEAGLSVPQPSAAAEAEVQRRLDLAAILEQAAALYRDWLWGAAGRDALEYLRRRGLTDDTIRAWNIGWSADGVRRVLAPEIPPERLLAAGLLRAGDDGAPGGDLFFRRVMLPIRDARGRLVSFGGRTLGDGQPKYVNGPETALFAKRRHLFGLDRAREGVRAGAPLIAVEGYFDAIALHQAGFTGAVAPLGTALTAEQLEALWRLAPAPTLCFDGDAAGARAAARAVEIALPLLSAERTLRFSALPPGEDPDSLVRGRGAPVFAAALAAAVPFSAALFAAKREAAGSEGPEARARLRRLLDEAVRTIPDAALRREYGRAFNDRLWAEGRPRAGAARRPHPPPVRRPPAAAESARRRDAILLAITVAHPGVLAAVEEALAGLALAPPWDAMRGAILDWAAQAPALDSAALATHLATLGRETELERLRAVLPVRATAEQALACWWHFYGLSRSDGLEKDVAAAQAAVRAAPSAAAFARLASLAAALRALRQGGDGEGGEWWAD